MILHIIGVETNYEVLFKRIATEDTVFFVANAVLSVLKNSYLVDEMKGYLMDRRSYVLADDIHIRGISEYEIMQALMVVNYNGLVTLTLEHSVIKSWY